MKISSLNRDFSSTEFLKSMFTIPSINSHSFLKMFHLQPQTRLLEIYACVFQEGKEAAMSLLCKKGCDVMARDCRGRTGKHNVPIPRNHNLPMHGNVLTSVSMYHVMNIVSNFVCFYLYQFVSVCLFFVCLFF